MSKKRLSRLEKFKDKALLNGLNSIGGLHKQIQEIKNFITLPIADNVDNFRFSSCILIVGPSGTGKSSVLTCLGDSLSPSINFLVKNGSEFVGEKVGKIQLIMQSTFEAASELYPSVIVFDDMDLIVSNKKSTSSEERKFFCLIGQFVTNMKLNRRIPIIGIIPNLDSISPYLLNKAHFFRHIEFPIPNPDDRKEIFANIMGRYKHLVSDECIKSLAESAHSFTGGDFVHVFEKASEITIMRGGKMVEEEDIKSAFRSIRPTVIRDITIEVPKVYWSDIGGYEDLKNRLIQSVVWPFKNSGTFIRHKMKPPKGILLYGPPGCSKTMIGRALATESGLNFLTVKGPELFDKYVGESEKSVRELFRRAKQASPAIIFFDELDALASERGEGSGSSSVGDRVSSQLLIEIDGIESLDGVIIIAATNRPDKIDRALLRPGRFDSLIYVPLPDFDTRKEIFRIKFRNMLIEENVMKNIERLSLLTEGYSGAEIVSLCNEAFFFAMSKDQDFQNISLEHFYLSLDRVLPQTDPELLRFYDNYQNKNKCRAFG